MRRLAVLLAACACLAGCATPLAVNRIDANRFTVQDTGEGLNPEKGLNRTCPKVDKVIVGYHVIRSEHRGDMILVQCR